MTKEDRERIIAEAVEKGLTRIDAEAALDWQINYERQHDARVGIIEAVRAAAKEGRL